MNSHQRLPLIVSIMQLRLPWWLDTLLGMNVCQKIWFINWQVQLTNTIYWISWTPPGINICSSSMDSIARNSLYSNFERWKERVSKWYDISINKFGPSPLTGNPLSGWHALNPGNPDIGWFSIGADTASLAFCFCCCCWIAWCSICLCIDIHNQMWCSNNTTSSIFLVALIG